MLLNLEWFRTFKTIYETGSLTSTAQMLYISQPGVSLHLSNLESYVGYRLFDRMTRKMVPTERAKVLYNFIIDGVTRLEEAEAHFHKSTDTERATISIGMCMETFQFTLEQYISSLPFNVSIRFGEYQAMEEGLDNGSLDLIITPRQGHQPGVEYTAFSRERIVLVSGGQQDSKVFGPLIKKGKYDEAEKWLKQQRWYSTAADMEHLRKFWHNNFDKHPDFRPNYIVPNKCSIVRCLSNEKGFAVIPDFLCRTELKEKKLRLVWEGKDVMENTLYFGKRKKTMFAREISLIESFFKRQSMP